MEKKILKDLNDILETKNLKPDTKISKLKFFDSIIYLQIITKAKLKYKLRITGDQLSSCKTINDIIALFKKKWNQ